MQRVWLSNPGRPTVSDVTVAPLSQNLAWIEYSILCYLISKDNVRCSQSENSSPGVIPTDLQKLWLIHRNSSYLCVASTQFCFLICLL